MENAVNAPQVLLANNRLPPTVFLGHTAQRNEKADPDRFCPRLVWQCLR